MIRGGDHHRTKEQEQGRTRKSLHAASSKHRPLSQLSRTRMPAVNASAAIVQNGCGLCWRIAMCRATVKPRVGVWHGP